MAMADNAKVTINPPTYVNYGPQPQVVTCSSCHSQVTTDMKTQPSSKTHIIALVLCLCGCLCCFWIPYCMDSCKAKHHHCPNCRAYLGTYKN